MSYFDDASLVMIPSGYKTSKVYSVKPTDGSGDLTFSRSNDTATRVNSAGLIEKVRTNYLLYSQDFSQWSTFGGATRTTGVTDPNGGTTAATISNLSSGNFDKGIVLNSNPMTIGSEPIVSSIWLKGTGTIAIYLERSISGTYFFYSKEITLTSTWTRYQLTDASAGSRGGFSFGISNFPSSTATSVDIAFGQTEFGDVATDYIATTSAAVSVGPVANVPRLDYLNSSCPRLLLEPQRTNLSTFSEQFNNTAWFKETGNSVTANTIASPDGYTNADTTTATSTNAININQSHTSASSSVHTFSIFLKKNNLSEIQVYIFSAGFLARAGVNLDNGTITDINGSGATITNYGNGWYRCSVQATINTGVGFTIGYLSASTTGSRSVYTYGAQLEVGAYATSYIPTLGAAVTRGADAASKTSASALIGQTEGTLFADITIPTMANTGANLVSISLFNAGLTNLTLFDIYDTGDLLGTCVNGTVQALITKSGFTAGRHKVAFGYKANDFVLYVDGVLVGTDTSGTVGAQDSFGLQYGTSQFIGQQYVSQALVFKTRLSNADLAALTTI